MSFVRCHVSGITCQVSGEGVGGFFVCLLVKVPLMAVLAAEKKRLLLLSASVKRFFVSCMRYFFVVDKLVELVGGGSVINGAYPV